MEKENSFVGRKWNVLKPLVLQRTKRFWVAAVCVVVLLAAADIGLSAPAAFPKGDVVFTMSSGETLKGVAQELAQDRYVRSALAFDVLVKTFGGERDLSPGDYAFRHDESLVGIAWQIARGDHRIEEVKVTVPEGEDVSQIAALIAQKIPNFDTATFIADATPDEGYLFPQTYFFYPDVTPAEVVSEMRAMFNTETAGLFTNVAATGHTEAEVVVMASLIEREASGDGDRATIAGILWKRLSLGMRLQVDATVGTSYDTYQHGGLPPTPLDDPGLLAIQAALDPTDTPYLYYLHDKNGTIHYAKTYAGQKANIAEYLQ